MPPPTSKHFDGDAEGASKKLGERMKRLQHAMDRKSPTRPNAGRSEPETVNPQPEHPERQEEQDAPSDLRAS